MLFVDLSTVCSRDIDSTTTSSCASTVGGPLGDPIASIDISPIAVFSEGLLTIVPITFAANVNSFM